VVADDVEHGPEALGAQSVGELAEMSGRRSARCSSCDEEIDAPVAVEAGLAAVGERLLAGDLVAAAELLVGVVDDGRDPDRAETHVADVVGVVEQAAEVAAEITEVVGFAVRCAQWEVEGAQCPALVAMVVRGSPLTKRSVSTK
jgi:hypothetical protein